MENEPVLVIMAAGMGSRYGGLKQIDKIGPNGEVILDYSVNDAISASFKKVIFIIKKEIEDVFKELVEPKFNGKIQTEYAYQEIDKIPGKFTLPQNRKKPWGTGHALLCAANEIGNNPFVVINSDDYYGKKAYKKIYNYFAVENNKDFLIIGYHLNNVLSKNGTVTRGICSVNKDKTLNSVKEISGLYKNAQNIIVDDNDNEYKDNTLASMNFWGLNKNFLEFAKKEFSEFLEKNINDEKAEFLLPSIINQMLGKEIVNVLETDDTWYGVTYKDDVEYVKDGLSKL